MIIGKFYRIPCVMVRGHMLAWVEGEFVPVIGPRHEDAEIVNFPYQHWHVDWRFVPESRLQFCASNPSARVFISPDARGQLRHLGEPVLKLRKMRRESPLFPSRALWLRRLEAKYAGACAKHGVCPHRGIPLDGAPIENGARVCPGHGLAFNLETGVLQPRPCPTKKAA